MSLVHGYSSDEGDTAASPTEDVFGLASLPAAKKIRIDSTSSSIVAQSAPDVLAEVRLYGHSLQ